MSKKTENTNDLSAKNENLIFNQEMDTNYFVNTINKKITEQDEKIRLINLELNNLEEFIDKTREFLLLEIESSLDKYKQLHVKNENKISHLEEFLENELVDNYFQFEDKLSSSTNKITTEENISNGDVVLGQESSFDSVEEDVLVQESSFDSVEEDVLVQDDLLLENSVNSNEGINNFINDLNNEINELKDMLSSKNNKINNLNKNIADKDEIIISFTNHITHLDEQIEIYKKDFVEKEKTIKLLSAENNILKSVINEKDKTLNSLNR